MTHQQGARGCAETAAETASETGRAPASGGRRRGLLALTAALALTAVTGCTAVQDLTQSPEEAAANQPKQVEVSGAKDEFPNLADVPKESRPYMAPEDREKTVEQMIKDRDSATFTTMASEGTEPAPLVTSAPPDPVGTSTIITGQSVTSSDQVAGLPAPTAREPGQLAAIIFFPNGSADLDPQDISVLQDVAKLHQQRGGRLHIVGHASSWTQNATPEEHQRANFEMSAKRASAVVAELQQLGVAADAMTSEALGDAEPVYHEFMPSGEAGNRRVEIFLEN